MKLNNFKFNGNHYLQIGGTAMGIWVAPSYANIFMGDKENVSKKPSKTICGDFGNCLEHRRD